MNLKFLVKKGGVPFRDINLYFMHIRFSILNLWCNEANTSTFVFLMAGARVCLRVLQPKSESSAAGRLLSEEYLCEITQKRNCHRRSDMPQRMRENVIPRETRCFHFGKRKLRVPIKHLVTSAQWCTIKGSNKGRASGTASPEKNFEES